MSQTVKKVGYTMLASASSVLAGIYQNRLGHIAWAVFIISGMVVVGTWFVDWKIWSRTSGAWKGFWHLPSEATPTISPDTRGASALAALPVHRQDLNIELLSIYVGTTLANTTTVFLELKTWARTDLNIVTVEVEFLLADGKHKSIVLRNLSEWLLSEEFYDHRFNSTNRRDVLLESDSHSFVKEIETGIFREGHHPPKWVGCEIENIPFIKTEDVLGVKVSVLDKAGIVKAERFTPPWPSSSHKIIDAEFRRR